MADFAGDKTHDPTPRRRQQARQAGRVAQSHDFNSAILLVGSLTLLIVAGGGLIGFLSDFMRDALGGNAWRAWIDADQTGTQLASDQIGALVRDVGRVLLPIVAGGALLALGASLLQGGFGFWPGRAAPDWSRVNPATGAGRVFSGASVARVLFGLFKIGVVGTIAAWDLWHQREELVSLAGLAPGELAAQAWDICFSTCVKIAGALLVLAAVDYLHERWRLERELRMTQQELRDELRELEGDPQVAARRRALRHERAPSIDH